VLNLLSFALIIDGCYVLFVSGFDNNLLLLDYIIYTRGRTSKGRLLREWRNFTNWTLGLVTLSSRNMRWDDTQILNLPRFLCCRISGIWNVVFIIDFVWFSIFFGLILIISRNLGMICSRLRNIFFIISQLFNIMKRHLISTYFRHHNIVLLRYLGLQSFVSS
jgi:hypothetical protein